MKRFLGFSLILICAGAVCAQSPISDKGVQGPFCQDGKPSKLPVVLGGVRYNLPAELTPNIVEIVNGKPKQSPPFGFKPCVPLNAPDVTEIEGITPYQLNEFVIQEGIFRKYTDKFIHWPAQLIVTGTDRPVYDPVKSLCKTKARLDKDTTWEPYKEDPNFMLATHTVKAPNWPAVQEHYLYSEKYKFWGLPILLRCDNLGKSKSTSVPSDCGYAWFISDSTRVYIRFNLIDTPADKIGAMLKEMEAFLRSISVNSPPDINFTSCEQSLN